MRDIFPYSLVMILGLGLAFWASAPKQKEDAKGTSIIKIEPSDIAKIEYETQKRSVTIENRSSRFWVSINQKENEPNSNKEATAKKSQIFLANSKIDKALESFSPLIAKRIVGPAANLNLSEFGLEASNPDTDDANNTRQELAITRANGTEWKLTLGKKSFGSSNRFALDSRENRVILIDGRPFENFEKAEFRIFEKQLIKQKWDDITNATISFAGQAKTLRHTLRNSRGALQWSSINDDAKPNPRYQSWMDKISRLKVETYLEADTTMPSAPILEIKLIQNSKPVDQIKFVKTTDQNRKPAYHVFSDHLSSWVEVNFNKADSIIKDASSIIEESED